MSRIISSSDSVVESYLEEAEHISGIEPDFDRTVADSSLGPNIPAATRNTYYGVDNRVDFVHNPYAFQELDENERTLATLHEILEEKQFNGFLGDTLRETHGISEGFKDFLNYAQVEFPNSLREGMTEAIAETLMPGGEVHGKRFYPRETDVFKTVLEGQDFDLEEELLEDETGDTGYQDEYTGAFPGKTAYIYTEISTTNNTSHSTEISEGYEGSLNSQIEEFYEDLSAAPYTEYRDEIYVEGQDGFIGTQEPETAFNIDDSYGNSFSTAGV